MAKTKEETKSNEGSAAQAESPPPSTPTQSYDEAELDAGGSLASKVLTGLALLVAGGVIALWAGPLIAPQLPAGLAPVAEFFAPQAASDNDLRLNALEDAQRSFENRVMARMQDLEASNRSLADQIEDLESRPSASGGSVSAADFARLDAAIDNLRGQVADLAARVQTGNGSSASPELQSALEQARRDLVLLRNEVAALTQSQSELDAELSSTTTDLETRLSLATANIQDVTQVAEIRIGTAQNRQLFVELERALDSGDPFVALMNNAEIDLPQALAGVADTGVSTLVELQSEFPDLAYAAIRADIAASAGENALGRVGAFFRQQVATRSLEPIEGVTTDAILSRMDFALSRGELERVTQEASGLPFSALSVLTPWLDRVTERVGAVRALQTLTLSSSN